MDSMSLAGNAVFSEEPWVPGEIPARCEKAPDESRGAGWILSESFTNMEVSTRVHLGQYVWV